MNDILSYKAPQYEAHSPFSKVHSFQIDFLRIACGGLSNPGDFYGQRILFRFVQHIVHLQ